MKDLLTGLQIQHCSNRYPVVFKAVTWSSCNIRLKNVRLCGSNKTIHPIWSPFYMLVHCSIYHSIFNIGISSCKIYLWSFENPETVNSSMKHNFLKKWCQHHSTGFSCILRWIRLYRTRAFGCLLDSLEWDEDTQDSPSQTQNLMMKIWQLVMLSLSDGQLVKQFHVRGITLRAVLIEKLILVTQMIEFSILNCFSYRRVN